MSPRSISPEAETKIPVLRPPSSVLRPPPPFVLRPPSSAPPAILTSDAASARRAADGTDLCARRCLPRRRDHHALVDRPRLLALTAAHARTRLDRRRRVSDLDRRRRPAAHEG